MQRVGADHAAQSGEARKGLPSHLRLPFFRVLVKRNRQSKAGFVRKQAHRALKASSLLSGMVTVERGALPSALTQPPSGMKPEAQALKTASTSL